MRQYKYEQILKTVHASVCQIKTNLELEKERFCFSKDYSNMKNTDFRITAHQKANPQNSCLSFPIKEIIRYFGEGSGTPLQYSCLENPMDGGA